MIGLNWPKICLMLIEGNRQPADGTMETTVAA